MVLIRHIKHFLILIRWFHALLGLLPFIALFLVIQHQSADANLPNLSVSEFVILCLGVELLMITGFILNDIVDRRIDQINKPNKHIVGRVISIKNAWLLFVFFTITLLILSVYVSTTYFPEWAIISPIIYLASIAYDLYLKRSPMFGNIAMAFITAGIPLVITLYAQYNIQELNSERLYVLIATYTLLPFMIIIPRELSLDISDMEGDLKDGCNTLPILIGEKKSKQVVQLLLTITLMTSILVMTLFPYMIYALLPLDMIILIYMIKLRNTKQRKDYIKLGRFLWIGMIMALILTTIVCF